jgi:hypothetical protein
MLTARGNAGHLYEGKERTSFLKKRSKKLLLLSRGAGTLRRGLEAARTAQAFFASFLQKRRVFRS